jgi:hypothetical protein
VVIRFDGRPALLNAERSGHWSVHRETTAALREETCLRARTAGLPVMDAVAARSWPTYASARSWPDVAAWMPATKAVLDGLVDAGVLRDDTWRVVRRSTFEAPRIGDADQLVVVVIPWDLAAADIAALTDAVEVPDANPRRRSA